MRLAVSGLAVRFGDVPALHPVTFALPPGASLAVTGPAGCGKSTLLWALAGAVGHEGEVLLDGVPLGDRTAAARAGVALAPQGNGLVSTLTAAENVVVPLLAVGVGPADARERADAALATLGLEESGNHLVDELSGGQQQRVAVARALALRPTVLLADEPTSDLDSTTRGLVVTGLQGEAGSGTVVVVATNDPEVAASFGAHLELDEGRPRWLRPPPRHSA